jgi:hypothetical protein
MLGWFKQKLKKLAYGAPVKREVGSVSFSRDGWGHGTIDVLELEPSPDSSSVSRPHTGIKLSMQGGASSETIYFSLTREETKSLQTLFDAVLPKG